VPDLTTVMTTSISEVFETAFFETVDIQPAKERLSMADFQDQCLTGAFIGFSKGLEGAVYVIAPDRWVSRMTADFLGIDPDQITEDQKTDTIKEATNMIAGHMFSLFDKDGRIQMGIPELIRRSPLIAEDIDAIKGTMVWVTTDTEKLAVVTVLNSADFLEP
jgi:CheY-specific phosphatase CheX